jgi:hypothetical protein
MEADKSLYILTPTRLIRLCFSYGCTGEADDGPYCGKCEERLNQYFIERRAPATAAHEIKVQRSAHHGD